MFDYGGGGGCMILYGYLTSYDTHNKVFYISSFYTYNRVSYITGGGGGCMTVYGYTSSYYIYNRVFCMSSFIYIIEAFIYRRMYDSV